jgi:hypothetical protein
LIGGIQGIRGVFAHSGIEEAVGETRSGHEKEREREKRDSVEPWAFSLGHHGLETYNSNIGSTKWKYSTDLNRRWRRNVSGSSAT